MLPSASAPWSVTRRHLPAELRVPIWLGSAVGSAVGAGALLGLGRPGASRPERLTRAVFFGAAFGYLGAALVDFAEHFRLEKAATGRYLAAVVVPPGETLNHAATIATIVAALAWLRPPATPPTLRDLALFAAPGLFLALGWRDELVYHRRRARHREDIMHTVSHLAAGVMWTALYTLRLAVGGR